MGRLSLCTVAMTHGEISLLPLEPWHGWSGVFTSTWEVELLFSVWHALEAGLDSFLCVHGCIPHVRLLLSGNGKGQCQMPCAGNSLQLRIEPTSHPSYWPFPGIHHDHIPLYSAHFIGCGCVLCPTTLFKGQKESLKWRILRSWPQWPSGLYPFVSLPISFAPTRIQPIDLLLFWWWYLSIHTHIQLSLLKLAAFMMPW